MKKEIREKIKEFKKNYGKYFDKVELVDVVSWLEYNFEEIEREWEEVIKEHREMASQSCKEKTEQLKKEMNDYWAHYLVWKMNQENKNKK